MSGFVNFGLVLRAFVLSAMADILSYLGVS